MPLSSTATQTARAEQEIATPATYPPGKMVAGVVQRPEFQLVLSPLSATTVHRVQETHETEYAPAFLNPLIGLAGVQTPSREVSEYPESLTAMQNLEAVQETESSPVGANVWLGAHFDPSNVRI